MVPNGETTVARNPTVPRLPRQIAAAGIDLFDRGASMIHNHIDDFRLCGQAAADRYAQGWAPILARHPDAVLCPTTAGGTTDAEKIAPFRAVRRSRGADGAARPWKHEHAVVRR